MTSLKSINEIASIVRGVSYSPSDVSEIAKEDYTPLLRAMNIDHGNLIFEDLVYVRNSCVSLKQKIKKGDVVIAASTGSKKVIGKAAQSENDWDGSFGAFCLVVRPEDNIVDPKYFGYFFQSDYYRKNISHMSSGANINNLKREYFDRLQIPIPPMDVQKEIVHILDHAFLLTKKRLQSMKLIDEYINSVFIEMFGDPINNPMQWHVNKLSQVCVKITDGTHHSPPIIDHGVPYVTAKHIRDNQVDFFSNPTYISSDFHKKIYARCSPEKGDVLYIKDGATTGAAAINKFDFEFSMLSSLALLKPDKTKINPYYLTTWLNNKSVKNKLIVNMAGAAIKRFTLNKINDFKINTPPIEFQNKFAQIIVETEKIKLNMLDQSNLIETQFKALMQTYFSHN